MVSQSELSSKNRVSNHILNHSHNINLNLNYHHIPKYKIISKHNKAAYKLALIVEENSIKMPSANT